MRLLWAKCVNFTYVWPQTKKSINHFLQLLSISLCSALCSALWVLQNPRALQRYIYMTCRHVPFSTLWLTVRLIAHTHSCRTRPYMANPHTHTHTTASSYPYKMLSLFHTHTHTHTHTLSQHTTTTHTPPTITHNTHYLHIQNWLQNFEKPGALFPSLSLSLSLISTLSHTHHTHSLSLSLSLSLLFPHTLSHTVLTQPNTHNYLIFPYLDFFRCCAH